MKAFGQKTLTLAFFPSGRDGEVTFFYEVEATDLDTENIILIEHVEIVILSCLFPTKHVNDFINIQAYFQDAYYRVCDLILACLIKYFEKYGRKVLFPYPKEFIEEFLACGVDYFCPEIAEQLIEKRETFPLKDLPNIYAKVSFN